MKKERRTLERKAYVKNGALRLFFAAFAIVMEIGWLFVLGTVLSMRAAWISTALSGLALFVAVSVYARRENAIMKMTWMMLIIAFPLLGVLLYLLTGLTGGSRAMRRRFSRMAGELSPYIPEDGDALAALSARYPAARGLARYISQKRGFPLFSGTDVRFHADATDGLRDLKEDLKKAERFIFMEYYAIEDSESFAGIREILLERACAGVEVRLFYDDIGSIFFINWDFVRRMEEAGIHCRVFNPMLPVANAVMNNRDHRKITVIDGRVGYTGGYNLADEYFHLKEPYGYWKDTGVRLEGPAVATLTRLFLTMWNAIRDGDEDDGKLDAYFPEAEPMKAEGFVQPYGDGPLETGDLGEDVYLSIVNGAREFCWFTTPYLIITDEMTRALCLAAGRGVDVRIVTPGIPDKKLTWRVTRSNSRRLARAGVRLYEYTPGFCHAKQCVADGEIAVCGTINLDYRSLAHNFEDAVLLVGCPAIADIQRDFLSLFPQCREMTDSALASPRLHTRLYETILRLIAPLL